MDDDRDTLDQLVDTDEAAAMLGYAPGYVRRLFAEGKLPGRKFGKGWATTRQAVEDYKQQRAKENDMDDQQIRRVRYGFHALDIAENVVDDPTFEQQRDIARMAQDAITRRLEQQWPDAEIEVEYDLNTTGTLPGQLREAIEYADGTYIGPESAATSDEAWDFNHLDNLAEQAIEELCERLFNEGYGQE